MIHQIKKFFCGFDSSAFRKIPILVYSIVCWLKTKNMNYHLTPSVYIFLFLLFVSRCFSELAVAQDEIEEVSDLYTIEGKVYTPEFYGQELNLESDVSVSINGGEYKGFLRDDGTFIISSVPSGSYVLEVHNPDYYYEPVSFMKFIILYAIRKRILGSCGNKSKRKVPST